MFNYSPTIEQVRKLKAISPKLQFVFRPAYRFPYRIYSGPFTVVGCGNSWDEALKNASKKEFDK